MPLLTPQRQPILRSVPAATGDAAADTAAIQAAIDSVPSTVGGTVHLQAGEYLCNQITVPWYVTLQGVPWTMEAGGTVIAPDGDAATYRGTKLLSNITNGADLLVFNPSPTKLGAPVIRDLMLQGTGTDGNGLVLYAHAWGLVERVFVRGFGKSGMVSDGGLVTEFRACMSRLNTLDGVTIRNSVDGPPANAIKFVGCVISVNGRDGIRCGAGATATTGLSNSEQIIVRDCDFEVNTNAVNILATSGVCHLLLDNVWVENHTWTVLASANADSATYINVRGARITQTAGLFSLGAGCLLIEPKPLLTRCKYAPATAVTKTTSSTSFGDVDATNLAVTFTAPRSGNVKVVMEALGNTAAGAAMIWGLRSGGSDVAKSALYMTTATANNRLHYERVFTGLTPGTVYTWKWAFKAGSATAVNLYASDTDADVGPATMEVWVES